MKNDIDMAEEVLKFQSTAQELAQRTVECNELTVLVQYAELAGKSVPDLVLSAINNLAISIAERNLAKGQPF